MAAALKGAAWALGRQGRAARGGLRVSCAAMGKALRFAFGAAAGRVNASGRLRRSAKADDPPKRAGRVPRADGPRGLGDLRITGSPRERGGCMLLNY